MAENSEVVGIMQVKILFSDVLKHTSKGIYIYTSAPAHSHACARDFSRYHYQEYATYYFRKMIIYLISTLFSVILEFTIFEI